MTSGPLPPENNPVPNDRHPAVDSGAVPPPSIPPTVSLPLMDDQATIIGSSDSFGADNEATPKALADVTEFGEYELLEEIGRGPHGVVYRARQPALDRVIAIKIMFPAMIPDAVVSVRFRESMERAARLDHPGIVRIIEVGTYDGFSYVAMGLCEGRRLDAVIANELLPVRESVRLLRELTEIIHSAHSQDVLHLGLKPSQVFVGRDGSLKVTDFGLTAGLGIENAPSDWTYRAPEQIREPAAAAGRPGGRSDLYAAGGILYALVTGRPPYREAGNVDEAIKDRRDLPMSPSRLNAEANDDLDAICLRCLEAGAWRRYTTAVELMGDLLRWLHHRPLKRTETGIARKGLLWMRRNRASLAPALFLLMVLGIIPEVGARVMQGRRWNDALTDLASPQKPVERYEQILRMARRAAAYSPSDKQARLVEGLAYFRLGRLEEAEPLLVADRRAVTRELLAELHFRKGDLSNAILVWSDKTPPAESAFRIEKAETDAMFHNVAGFVAALRAHREKHPESNTGNLFGEFCQLFLNATEPAEWRSDEVSSSVPLWQEIATDQRSELRKLAAEALGRIGPGARAAVPALARLMVDRDVRPENGDDTSLVALSAIRRIDATWIHSHEARSALDKLRANLFEQDYHKTLPAIAEFGSAAEPLLGDLIEWLGHRAGDDAGRDAVVAALDRIDPDWRTSAASRKALAEWQAEFRNLSSMKRSVAHAAGRFGRHGRPLLTELVVFAAWSEEFETLARQILPAIEKDWEQSPEARAAISEIVSQIGAADPSLWRNRDEPLSFLDRSVPDWRDSQEAEEGVRRLVEKLSSRERDGQVLRIEFLARCGVAARAALPALAEALADRETDVRRRAHEALERIDPEWTNDVSARAAILPLALRATVPDAEVRTMARDILHRIDPQWAKSDAENVRPALIAELTVQERAAATMALLDESFLEWPKSSATQALIPSLIRSSVSSYLPHGFEVLERLDPPWYESPEAEKAVPELVEKLGPEILGYTQTPLVLDRLARIGPRARAASDRVAEYLTNGEPSNARAVIALSAIDSDRLATLVRPPTSDEVRVFRVDRPPKSDDEREWHRATWEFQATSHVTRIAFLPLDEREPSDGPCLDDVRMTRADDPADAANQLLNGDFEAGTPFANRRSLEIDVGSRYLKDWTISGKTVTLLALGEGDERGSRSVVLGGTQGWGGVSQDRVTEPGKKYRITFSHAAGGEHRGATIAVRATGLTPLPANDKGERRPSPEERFLALEEQFLKTFDRHELSALRKVDPQWGTSPQARMVVPAMMRRLLSDTTRASANAILTAFDPRWSQTLEALAMIGELVERLPDESMRVLELLAALGDDWRIEPGCQVGIAALLRDLAKLPAAVTAQRIRILEAIHHVGPAAADAAPALVEYLPHEDLAVAKAAAEALDTIDPEWTKRPKARSILLPLAWRGFRGGEKHAQFAKDLIDRIRAE